MHRRTGQVLVGKGHQRMHATDTGIQVSNTMQHKRTGYVLWRTLVIIVQSVDSMLVREANIHLFLIF